MFWLYVHVDRGALFVCLVPLTYLPLLPQYKHRPGAWP
jgi:hypothetical protein